MTWRGEKISRLRRLQQPALVYAGILHWLLRQNRQFHWQKPFDCELHGDGIWGIFIASDCTLLNDAQAANSTTVRTSTTHTQPPRRWPTHQRCIDPCRFVKSRLEPASTDTRNDAVCRPGIARYSCICGGRPGFGLPDRRRLCVQALTPELGASYALAPWRLISNVNPNPGDEAIELATRQRRTSVSGTS
jgi:hypothetical protein